MPSAPSPGSTPGTLLAVIASVVITGGITMALHARVTEAEPGSNANAMPVASTLYRAQSGYERQQEFLGLVQAATRSQVGFEVPGAIEQIHVNEGETVAAGQPLASLDTQALDARRRAAAATVEQVAAELELAKARTQRQAPLKDSGAISAQTFDDTRLAQKALLSGLESARAQLRALDIELEKSVLRAPYAARIGRRLLDRGAVTQPGTPVFTLIASGRREAHIGVAVEQASFMEPGKRYTLVWRDTEVAARLRAVRPDVNPVSMTTVAIFDLPGDVAAFDGEPIAVRIPREVAAEGGWLPLSALLEGERGVWTVLALQGDDTRTTTRREVVEVLHVSGDRAYVHGTLSHGDRVIADGIHRIAPGTLVRTDVAVAATGN